MSGKSPSIMVPNINLPIFLSWKNLYIMKANLTFSVNIVVQLNYDLFN